MNDEPSPADLADGYVCPTCRGMRTIQPDRCSPPEPCPTCVDPDADETECDTPLRHTDIGALTVTMLDSDADPLERANAAQQVLTYLYGGGPVPAVWPGTRETLLDWAREVRGLRPTLDQSVPRGTLIDEPTDKEPNHE